MAHPKRFEKEGGWVDKDGKEQPPAKAVDK